MQNSLTTFFSNRVEVLYHQLIEHLFTDGDSFAKRIVVVPSPAMKSWLTLRMAQDPKLTICMGIEIVYLEAGLEKALHSAFELPTSYSLPSSLELSLLLPTIIAKKIEEFPLLTLDQQVVWKPLVEYLQVKPGGVLSRKGEKRLASLSEKLSHLFKQYGRYGALMLKDWEEGKSLEWQADLWNEVYCHDERKLTYPYRLYSCCFRKKSSSIGSLHLFAMSYLSTLQFQFLKRYAELFPTYHYLLSPCALFWSDSRSDKEKRAWKQHLKNSGVNEKQERELEELLRDQNPLLANFGRLGREMITQIEESQSDYFGTYIAPKCLLDYPEYKEYLGSEINLEESGLSLTLLEAVQADLLLMRHPKGGEKVTLEKEDSLQVHIAPSKMREVEVLYDNLLRLIDHYREEDLPLYPSDIVVLTPDIAEYQPYIQAVFGAKSSQIDYQLMDLKAPVQCQLIQAFLYLLDLPLSRWDTKVILQLFAYPHFQKRQGFSIEELHEIRVFAKKAKIYWGESSHHREEILSNSHLKNGMVDKSEVGTWEEGLSRLIRSLALIEKASPIQNLELSTKQSETVARVSHLLRSLREDLSLLIDGTRMSVSEWSDYLELLLESYFIEDGEEKREYTLLLEKIRKIGQSGGLVKEEKYSFITVKKLLVLSLEQQHISFRENHVQAVRFCSMLPMRAIPSRVVAVMGMGEGKFPKGEFDLSLNALKGSEKCDYCPSQVDYDRYLFLEVLLSARQHLLLSFASYSLEEDQELLPSLMITELLDYLDKGYTVEGKSPKEICISRHPFRSFSPIYYCENNTLKSYSEKWYQAACSEMQREKKAPHQFAFTFSKVTTKKQEEVCISISIKELEECVKNPLKLYFNKILGIYLKGEKDQELQAEEEFTLSPIDRSSIRKLALTNPEREILEEAKNSGIMPFGLFSEVAKEKALQDIGVVKEHLSAHAIEDNQITTLTFSEDVLEPHFHEESGWSVPPIYVSDDEREMVITGKIEDLSPKGMLVNSDDKWEALLKHFSSFVLLGVAIESYQLPFEWAMIPYRAKKMHSMSGEDLDPHQLLKQLIPLYFHSIENPSPFIPEWSKELIKGEEKELSKQMDKRIHDTFTPLYNDYLLFTLQQKIAPPAEKIIHQWQCPTKEALSPLLNKWFPKVLGEEVQ